MADFETLKRRERALTGASPPTREARPSLLPGLLVHQHVMRRPVPEASHVWRMAIPELSALASDR
jgi:hypothetical protein